MSQDDTISTDPKMQAEARRAAAESAAPKPPYDPKAIAREEYERVSDRRYDTRSFEDLWTVISKSHDLLHGGDATLGVLTEAEFRQFAASLCYGANALMLERAAAAQKERSAVLYKAASYAARDRLAIEEKVGGCPDMLRGLYRSASSASSKGVCVLHPNGCPENPEPGTVIRDLIGALLSNK